jgi:hypothetical protein
MPYAPTYPHPLLSTPRKQKDPALPYLGKIESLNRKGQTTRPALLIKTYNKAVKT